jgi:hypothetical protein
VLVCEGELLDGTTPASLAWSTFGGTIKVKADKILGIMEGRTRIKAVALQELYPGLFEKPPHPGTEFNIPLQAVITQLEDLFASVSSEEVDLEDFSTPFGRLAREDEARLKDQTERTDEAEKTVSPELSPELLMLPQPASSPEMKTREESAGPDTRTPTAPRQASKEEKPLDDRNVCSGAKQREFENETLRAGQMDRSAENVVSTLKAQSALAGGAAVSSGIRMTRCETTRREAHDSLQELYLTDESLDGPKVAELILHLPRVAGVVIMLSDGAALGGGISGGLSEELLSLTPGLVKHLFDFANLIQQGPVKFVSFSGDACQVSLTMCGQVVILAEHLGKRLPPGLRERFVATAQALNVIYGSPA